MAPSAPAGGAVSDTTVYLANITAVEKVMTASTIIDLLRCCQSQGRPRVTGSGKYSAAYMARLQEELPCPEQLC
ncbi:hypothetical protein EHS86_12855 [Erwinia amylovora]|uniref:Uncharacterized protein n=3 Tax=Erwinia amylovora TaxID=552 RepID=A0A830ZX70_ERWAM|nr:hypothetical protein AD997_11740 [Erwinia amylovora]EKV53404.1 hypothetical protein EaACW_2408 [Erwinia amylovora ACW56400]CBA21627.1 hypothetical protein predicted by Glimmer/Critica [Erwinia amylovora CFBP1430]CBX81272.1 hypothetical protein predicted by Glimmer/Critica [Erwinia amylovora ATCC BAA-2158]CCO79254.1 hypothetical protein BN432_2467 [Erwinia amylovora Ea356]CCO83059.1 hypothetical protein BN433_2499 [Erwinia amylovora Ea266]CCO86822.1 hypothetical protein BN434_2444 [Erwinia 